MKRKKIDKYFPICSEKFNESEVKKCFSWCEKRAKVTIKVFIKLFNHVFTGRKNFLDLKKEL